MTTPTLSSNTLIGDPVKNPAGEQLGTVKEVMFDLEDGRVAYIVMASGGILGMGDSYFAVPWSMLTVDTDDKSVVVDVGKETIENAPGFDKDDWPNAEEVSRLEHY